MATGMRYTDETNDYTSGEDIEAFVGSAGTSRTGYNRLAHNGQGMLSTDDVNLFVDRPVWEPVMALGRLAQ